MENKFQSSFIPKSSVIGPERGDAKQTLFGLVAIVLFAVSVLSFVGVFAYKKISESSVNDLGANLASAEAGIDKNSINKLVDFDKKLKAINEILGNHVAVSGYLKMLEANTLSNVQFTNLKYSAPTASSPIAIMMEGKTNSYASIAQEESVLLANQDISSASFDNLSLDGDTGNINFTLKAELKDDVSRWKNLIAPQTPAPDESTASTTNQ